MNIRVPSSAVATPMNNQSSSEETVVEQVRESQEMAQMKSEVQDQITKEQAKQMADSMNHFLETVDTQLRFKYHDKLNEYYVTIVDSKTDKVVREIPSKKLMDIHAAMREYIGLLVDQKI
ncbi:flagellar protein FlaG [Savagea faecisuis]|uniref:Flagellar protein FlaG n=1 Tax=Savagea faecisuis TaxID=1274803 RepID=A0ABW3GXD5_9BACL